MCVCLFYMLCLGDTWFMYMSIYIYVNVCMYVCVCVHARVYYILIDTWFMYICMNIYVNVCMYVCACACVCVRTCARERYRACLCVCVQDGENAQDTFSCRSHSVKEPLILGLFCGKWPIKIRHPMHLRHRVTQCSLRTACVLHVIRYIIYVHIYIYVCICICMYACACACVCERVCVCVCVCVWMCVCGQRSNREWVRVRVSKRCARPACILHVIIYMRYICHHDLHVYLS